MVTYYHRETPAVGFVLRINPRPEAPGGALAHVRAIELNVLDFGPVSTSPAIVPVAHLSKLVPQIGADAIDAHAWLGSKDGKAAMQVAVRVFLTITASLRGAMKNPEVVALLEPIRGEIAGQDAEGIADVVASMFLVASAGSASTMLGRILQVPVDDLAHAAWGDDPACTTWQDIVEEHAAAEDEEEREGTQLAQLRVDVERIRGLLVAAALGLPAGAKAPSAEQPS
jgi:hypothetical protein